MKRDLIQQHFFFLLLRNNNGINIVRCGAKRYFSTLLSLLSLVCVSIMLSSTIFRNVCRYLCENQQQPQRMEQMDETNESFHFSLAAIWVSTIASTHTKYHSLSRLEFCHSSLTSKLFVTIYNHSLSYDTQRIDTFFKFISTGKVKRIRVYGSFLQCLPSING